MITNKKLILITGALLFTIIVVIVGILFLNKYQKRQEIKENTISKRISRYIQDSCENIEKCRINFSDFTNFEWDTFCFHESGYFEPASIVPAPLPEKYSFINGKMVFILHGKMVLFEEIPLEIENIPTGTVLFDLNNVCYPNESNMIFSVKKIDNGLGGAYSLFLPQESSN